MFSSVFCFGCTTTSIQVLVAAAAAVGVEESGERRPRRDEGGGRCVNENVKWKGDKRSKGGMSWNKFVVVARVAFVFVFVVWFRRRGDGWSGKESGGVGDGICL